MITPEEQDFITEQSYVPEHVVSYVTAVSGAEPFLLDDFLVYFSNHRLIFVGYPLRERFEAEKIKKTLDLATKRFKPDEIAITSPSLPPSMTGKEAHPRDDYYRLDLSAVPLSQKLRNMIKRANRNVSVKAVTDYTAEHGRLVDEFLQVHPVDEAIRFIFQKIPDYLATASTAVLFEARGKDGELAAFDIFDFGPRHYGLYMFNFSSRSRYVPGVSDLLLFEAVKRSMELGKRYINLGLGLNAGVAFFKRKWGGVPFLPHLFCVYKTPKRLGLETFLRRLQIV